MFSGKRINELEAQVKSLEEQLQAEKAAHEADIRRLTDERGEAQKEIISRIKAFGDNYSYYLSQVTAMMELLNNAAIKTAGVFLTEEMPDTGALFKEEMGEHTQRFCADANGAQENKKTETDAGNKVPAV